jgi:hypothetical protein
MPKVTDRYYDMANLEFMERSPGYSDFEGFTDGKAIVNAVSKVMLDTGFNTEVCGSRERFEFIRAMVLHYISGEISESDRKPTVAEVRGAIWGLWAATESRFMMKVTDEEVFAAQREPS